MKKKKKEEDRGMRRRGKEGRGRILDRGEARRMKRRRRRRRRKNRRRKRRRGTKSDIDKISFRVRLHHHSS